MEEQVEIARPQGDVGFRRRAWAIQLAQDATIMFLARTGERVPVSSQADFHRMEAENEEKWNGTPMVGRTERRKPANRRNTRPKLGN